MNTDASVTSRPHKPRKGRPRLRPEEATNSEQRRAQLRATQRTFRLRKVQHISFLEQRVSSLEDVVEGMSDTFLEFTEELISSENISMSPKLALSLKRAMENFVRLSRKVAVGDQMDEGARQEMESAHTSAPQDGSYSVLVEQPKQSLLVPSLVPLPNDESAYAVTATPVPNLLTYQGPTMDFPLSDGLWSGSPGSLSTPPNAYDIVSYIIAGRDSFAGRLYWNTMSIAHSALTAYDSQSTALVQSIFGYKLRYCTRDKILSVISGILDEMAHGMGNYSHRSVGYINGTSSDSTSTLHSRPAQYVDQAEIEVTKDAITRDIVQDGGVMEEFLDSWAVEKYLREAWDLDINSSVVRSRARYNGNPAASQKGSEIQETVSNFDGDGVDLILAPPVSVIKSHMPAFQSDPPWTQDPFGDTVLSGTRDIQGLIAHLSESAVTIGTGPRFPIWAVDAAVRELLLP